MEQEVLPQIVSRPLQSKPIPAVAEPILRHLQGREQAEFVAFGLEFVDEATLDVLWCCVAV